MAAQESGGDVKCTAAANSKVAAAAGNEGAASSAPATPFKFNVHAPEFVPMSPNAGSPLASPMSAPAASGYYSPFMQMQAGGMGPTDWSFFHDHEPVFFMPDFAKFGAAAAGSNSSSTQAKGTGATADVTQKIVKQVGQSYVDPCTHLHCRCMHLNIDPHVRV